MRLGFPFAGAGVLDSDFSRLSRGGGEGSDLTDGVSGGGLTSSRSSSFDGRSTGACSASRLMSCVSTGGIDGL